METRVRQKQGHRGGFLELGSYSSRVTAKTCPHSPGEAFGIFLSLTWGWSQVGRSVPLPFPFPVGAHHQLSPPSSVQCPTP